MSNSDIKKIAKYTASFKIVPEDVAQVVLNKLSRRELILYLRYLKALLDQQTVRIVSNDPIPSDLKKKIESQFLGKLILFDEDKSASPGIKAVINDTTIDLSVTGYLDQTIDLLEQNL